jgi:hypothetical protein
MSGPVKRAVRKRDGYACVQCGMTNAQHRIRWGGCLEVHRIVPGSLYTIEGCTTLCKTCHQPQPKRPKGSGAATDGLGFTPEMLSRLFQTARRLGLDVKSLLSMIVHEWLPLYEERAAKAHRDASRFA